MKTWRPGEQRDPWKNLKCGFSFKRNSGVCVCIYGGMKIGKIVFVLFDFFTNSWPFGGSSSCICFLARFFEVEM